MFVRGQTFLDREPYIRLWRPFYRRVVTPLRQRIATPAPGGHEPRASPPSIAAFPSGLVADGRAMQEEMSRQWASLEQLVLAILSQSSQSDPLAAERLAELAAQVAAVNAQNRILLERLHQVQQACQQLAERQEALDAEARRRWEAVEQLLMASLVVRPYSPLAGVDWPSGTASAARAGAGGDSRPQ